MQRGLLKGISWQLTLHRHRSSRAVCQYQPDHDQTGGLSSMRKLFHTELPYSAALGSSAVPSGAFSSAGAASAVPVAAAGSASDEVHRV